MQKTLPGQDSLRYCTDFYEAKASGFIFCCFRRIHVARDIILKERYGFKEILSSIVLFSFDKIQYILVEGLCGGNSIKLGGNHLFHKLLNIQKNKNKNKYMIKRRLIIMNDGDSRLIILVASFWNKFIESRG